MATLTSAGAVNLTSSTNWSPAQVPVAGDDLIIGAHTLTLDADMTLNTITFSNASSRLAISGTTRSVQATNGFILGATLSGQLIPTAIPTGTSLTLTGSWLGSTSSLNGVASSTGGNLTLQTVGGNQSGVLIPDVTASFTFRTITSSWTAGTLTTIGLIQLAYIGYNNTLVSMTGGNWVHQSSGVNSFGPSSIPFISLAGSATLNWTGSIDSNNAAANQGVIVLTSSSPSHTLGQVGDTFLQRNSAGIGALLLFSAGVIELTGRFTSRNRAVVANIGSGTVYYRNQSLTIPATDTFGIYQAQGTLDISGLVVTNPTKFLIAAYGGSVTTSSGTSVTNTTSSATACAFGTSSLDGKIITLESDPPTLPAVQNVASGTVYGYSGTQLTGTGLLLDPAVLSSAVSWIPDAVNAKSTIEGTANTGSTTTSIVIKSSNVTPTVTNQWKGRVLLFDNDTPTAALRGQGAPIDSSSTTTLTFAAPNALTTAPAENDTFTIY
jgi:hypothetical protein